MLEIRHDLDSGLPDPLLRTPYSSVITPREGYLMSSGGGQEPRGPDRNQLRRKANLGVMIEMTKSRVPDMLQVLLPEQYVSKDIILRVLPHQLPKLPEIKGYMLYATTVKTFQLLLTSFYLNPQSRLHITHLKVEEPTSSKLSPNIIDALQDTNRYATKIIVKFRTCIRGCPDLHNSSTTSAKLGSFSFDDFDLSRLISSKGMQLPARILSELAPRSQSKRHEKLERVITGSLIFELNPENTIINVITVDNCDVLENGETNPEEVIGFAPS